jgi:osmoprotectant transport system substrate-binding protein
MTTGGTVPRTISTSRSFVLRCAAALVAAAGLAGCGLAGSSSSQLDSVVIGSANFSESQLIAEVYAQALEAEGVEVEQVPNIGAREAYMRSIVGDNPSINVLPEYLGYLLEYFNDDIPDTSVDAVKQQLAKERP